ncbi:hypothetical protein ACKC9G_13340 [Pokkaliibacter sp. CJK22405]|uniref:hypothetical protein n=1 Tax=Pokkaliibacter sp. CJK22405 TaxID=3384615 RepID=UPI0039854D87
MSTQTLAIQKYALQGKSGYTETSEDIFYSTTVYRAQYDDSLNNYSPRLTHYVLPKGRPYTNRIPSSYLVEGAVSANTIEDSHKLRNAKLDDLKNPDIVDHPIRMDCEMMRHFSTGKLDYLIGLFPLFYGFSRVLFWLSIIFILPLYLIGTSVDQEAAVGLARVPLIGALIFGAAWFISYWAMPLFARLVVKLARPAFAFNRRTGMVILYDTSGQRGRVKAEVPFSRMVAECSDMMADNGIQIGVKMDLRQVDSPNHTIRLTRGFFPFANTIDQAKICWDFLQQYMDVTRPLPDIPSFEAWRPLDPTTSHHDKLTGRPERYWRDMPDDVYKQLREQIKAKEKK